jgi:hypothetical protein
MRHIGTLIAAIVIGPLAWILIAFGQDRSAAAFANVQKNNGAFHTGDFVRPLIFLLAAGLILGLIATLRFSPLGAGLTGVVYVLSYVWLFIDAKGLLNIFKHPLSIGGETADPTIPVRTGTTLLVGALLLVSVVSMARWRRWPRPGAATAVPAGTAPDPADPYGLGAGDPSMFRSETTAVPVGAGTMAGSSGESTESVIPAQSTADAPAPSWPVSSESPTRLVESDQSGSAGRTPSGSPWSTPLRDESDK